MKQFAAHWLLALGIIIPATGVFAEAVSSSRQLSSTDCIDNPFEPELVWGPHGKHVPFPPDALSVSGSGDSVFVEITNLWGAEANISTQYFNSDSMYECNPNHEVEFDDKLTFTVSCLDDHLILLSCL